MNSNFSKELIPSSNSFNAFVPSIFFLALWVCSIDIPNIRLEGNTLRIANVVLPFLFAIHFYVYGIRISRRDVIVSIALLTSLLPSLIWSINADRSLIYLGWLFFHLFFVFIFFRNIVERNPERCICLWINFFRLSVVVSAFQWLLGLQERASFFLYEPSYYSIFLIPYFCLIAFNWSNSKLKVRLYDYTLIFIAVLVSQSASMVVWIAICFFIASTRNINLFKILFLLCFGIFIGIALYKLNDRANLYIGMALGAEELSDFILTMLSIGGNRLQRVMTAWDVFLAHPWTGVGLGNFEVYAKQNLQETWYTEILAVEDFSIDLPATNIFLEIASTSGLLGLFGFLFFFIFIIKSGQAKNPPLMCACIVSIIALMFESTYLRLYFWGLLGIYAAATSGVSYRR